MSGQQQITNLLTTHEFRSLQKIGLALQEEESRFDLLSLFDDVLFENSWSRFFTYLFNSTAEHKLGQRFFRMWLKVASNADGSFADFLNRIPAPAASQTIAVSEWQTPNGRRIDILIRVLDSTNKTVAVVGLENKVDSGEQADQIADYQRALIQCFPNISKLTVFLTPDGREPQTSICAANCRCIAVSYSSIVLACEKLLPQSEGQATVLLQVLNTHISRMLGANKMEKRIKSFINQLYRHPDHREAMKLIIQYAPNITSVFDGLREFFESLPKRNLSIPVHNKKVSLETYSTKEFKMQFDELDNISDRKGIYAVYMLHFAGDVPDVNDRFTLRVMLWDENLIGKNSAVKERLKTTIQSKLLLSGSLGEHRHWGPWISLWVGDSYQLVDMGSKDVKGLSNLLLDGIRKTYPELKKKLTAFIKNPVRYR